MCSISTGNPCLGSRSAIIRPSAAALADWMQHRRASQQQSEAAKLALARNLVLFDALRVRSVPALVYKDQAGELVVKAGVTPL